MSLQDIINGKRANKIEADRIAKAETLQNAIYTMNLIQKKIDEGGVVHLYSLVYNEIEDSLTIECRFKNDEDIKASYKPYGSVINQCVSNDIIIINADIQKIVDEL